MMNAVLPMGCTRCGQLGFCVCDVKRDHKDGCPFRRAALLSMELACEHGLQACPVCDPCTCGIKNVKGRL